MFDCLLLLNQYSRLICFVHAENEYEIRVISFRKTTKRESQIYLMKSKTDWVRLKSGAAEAKPVHDLQRLMASALFAAWYAKV